MRYVIAVVIAVVIGVALIAGDDGMVGREYQAHGGGPSYSSEKSGFEALTYTLGVMGIIGVALLSYFRDN